MAQKIKVKGSHAKKRRLLSEYKKAVAERRRLVNYLKGASRILSKPEQELLLEFAEILKRKCDRLRRAIRQHSARHAA
jgi:hypothetical protein